MYPASELVRRHRSSRVASCLWVSGSVFSWLCIFMCFSVFCVLVCVLFVLFGERFYEGLISILDSEVCSGPIV